MELYLYFLPNLPDELPLLCDLTHETRNSPVQVHVFTFITNATKKGGGGQKHYDIGLSCIHISASCSFIVLLCHNC